MTNVQQAGMLSLQTSLTIPAATQVGALAALSSGATFSIDVTTSGALVSTEGRAQPSVSQAGLLVAYRTDAPENLQLRASTLTFDGHEFYVLTLGEQGTWLYDLTTGQWCQWRTSGLNSWNMELTVAWRGEVIGGDRFNPILWRLNPQSFLDDDFKPQTRVVTGGLSIRNRLFPANYAFRVSASMGEFFVGDTAPPTLPSVELSISDDQGVTYQSMGEVVIEENNHDQRVQFLSLGLIQSPLRVYRVTDTGAIARIYGADAEVDGESDGG